MISNSTQDDTNFNSANHDQSKHFDSRQQSSRRSRVGLMPTEGQDAYKRSSARASRRSRPERASYMMANGHLDMDEIQQLTGKQRSAQRDDQLLRQDSINSATTTTTLTVRPDVSGQPDLLDIAAPNHYADFQDNIFAHNNLKSISNKYKSNQLRKSQDRGKFKQTYTEVALPMKTSPAFEYIIKDNKRRNRRCFLWLLYTVLMIGCIAVIVYCSIQLVVRYHLI